MTPEDNYKLTNIRKKELKLRAQRQEILSADAQKALDLILEAPAPAALIQSFPDQDLYVLIHRIGPYDCVPILSNAASSQWEYFLDMEIWDQDRFDLAPMTRILDLLFQADPDRLLRWGVSRKTELFEYYLSKHLDLKIREHDEPPPEDFDDYLTLDEKFYFRFPRKAAEQDEEDSQPDDIIETASELIDKMLNRLADMDLSVFHALMMETSGLLPAETEEEEFRRKNIRLAEKGFLPTHEAIGIYQSAPLSSLRKRPEILKGMSNGLGPDIALPPQFFSRFIKGDNLFVQTIKRFEPPFAYELESELAALINKVVSADKITLRSLKDLEKAIHKTCAYLNLGMEQLMPAQVGPDLAEKTLSCYFLEDIFRVGSGLCIKLKTQADKWFKNSFLNKQRLPLSFLDETFLGVMGGLLIDRPMFYDEKAVPFFYRDFADSEDIAFTRSRLQQIMDIDRVLGCLDVDLSSFTQGVLTYKALLLTLWAKQKLKLPATLEPIETGVFKIFFKALFHEPQDKETENIALTDFSNWILEATGLTESDLSTDFFKIPGQLMDEISEEYGAVDLKHIDPRFVPHFLLC